MSGVLEVGDQTAPHGPSQRSILTPVGHFRLKSYLLFMRKSYLHRVR